MSVALGPPVHCADVHGMAPKKTCFSYLPMPSRFYSVKAPLQPILTVKLTVVVSVFVYIVTIISAYLFFIQHNAVDPPFNVTDIFSTIPDNWPKTAGGCIPLQPDEEYKKYFLYEDCLKHKRPPNKASVLPYESHTSTMYKYQPFEYPDHAVRNYPSSKTALVLQITRQNGVGAWDGNGPFQCFSKSGVCVTTESGQPNTLYCVGREKNNTNPTQYERASQDECIAVFKQIVGPTDSSRRVGENICDSMMKNPPYRCTKTIALKQGMVDTLSLTYASVQFTYTTLLTIVIGLVSFWKGTKGLPGHRSDVSPEGDEETEAGDVILKLKERLGALERKLQRFEDAAQ